MYATHSSRPKASYTHANIFGKNEKWNKYFKSNKNVKSSILALMNIDININEFAFAYTHIHMSVECRNKLV